MASDSKGKSKTGIGFRYAWNGFTATLKAERNFRIHVAAASIAIILCIWLQVTLAEWAVIVLAIGMVLVTEMLNTVIENLLDHLAPDIHPVTGLIKDISAAAVMLAALTAIIVGAIVFIPKIAAYI